MPLCHYCHGNVHYLVKRYGMSIPQATIFWVGCPKDPITGSDVTYGPKEPIEDRLRRLRKKMNERFMVIDGKRTKLRKVRIGKQN
jgi:hypothetical protein